MWNDNRVHIVKTDEYKPELLRESLERIFSAFGGIENIIKPNQRVIVKPNLIAKRFESQTNPVLTVELARMSKQAGADVIIADSPAWASIKYNAKHSGLLKLADKCDIPIRQLSKPLIVNNPQAKYFHRLIISKDALNADIIINVPKLKTHQQLKLSGGIKNMFGCVPGKLKAWWHFKGTQGNDESKFAVMIVETCLLLKPAFTIVDAIDAMEGFGPISGSLRHIGALIGSPNPVAADVVSARLVNCEIESVPILQATKKLGLSPDNFDEIDLTGDDIEQLIVKDFDFPELIPIRFSLVRVAKSIAKQIAMLSNAKVTGRNK